MTEQQIDNKEEKKLQAQTKGYYIPYPVADTWAGAVKEFFKQLGSVSALLLVFLFMGQGCGFIDIYRLLGK